MQDDLDETMTMWTYDETMKCFSNTCWLLLMQCENGSKSDKLLVNERESVTRLLLVTVRCTRLMKLVR